MRDLLRRHSRLLQQPTANVLAVQNRLARSRGCPLSANEVKGWTWTLVVLSSYWSGQLYSDPEAHLMDIGYHGRAEIGNLNAGGDC